MNNSDADKKTLEETKIREMDTDKKREQEVIQPKKQPIDFEEIYNKLHEKSPKVFNLEDPVMFAVQIHKEIKEFTGLTDGEVRFWVGKYMRKSKYYKKHNVGTPRYNFNGEQEGEVTEEHVTRMNEKLRPKKASELKNDSSDNNS